MNIEKKAPEKKGKAGSPVSREDRKEALKNALAQIEKQFGKGAIMKMGENPSLQVEAISTGSLGLDVALGIGGIPRGRVIEIYGPESSGKTTLALHCVAEAQKAGGEAAFIDVEHALDPVYAAQLGVDVDSLLVAQPDSGEQALEIAETLVRSGAIDVIVVDSVAALVTRAEIEGEMGDAHVGVQARLMSQAMRKLAGAMSKANCAAIFINQLREKVGVMYGNPEVTPGGRALKFYASVRIDVRKIDTIKVGTEVLGNRTRAKVVKNKVAPPFREAEFDILYGQGISRESELIEVGTRLDVIQKSGSWLYYGEMRLGQGKDNAREFIKANPELQAEIEQKLRRLMTGAAEEKSEEQEAADAAEAAALAAEEQADAAELGLEPLDELPVFSTPFNEPRRVKPRDGAKTIDISAEDFE